MAKTILEVPVDTSQFADFLKLFEGYRDAVGKLPGAWGDVGTATEASGSAFASMTAALLAQQRLLHEQTEAKKAAAKATKDAGSLEAKAIRDRAAANRQAVKDTKAIASNVKGATLDLLKWVSIGSLGGLVGGALGFWGLDRLAAGVGNERRSALGYGVSTGERQALAVNYQKFFDTNSALENVAQAQNDPSKAWIWSGLGIKNAASKDAAQLAIEAASAVKKLASEVSAQNLQPWAQAHGALELFSMDEVRRLKNIGGGELSEARGGFGRDVTRFGLSEKNAVAWQRFTTNLEEAGWAIKNNFMDHLTKAEPGLVKIMNAFTNVATTAIDHIDFQVIADGLDQFAKYIGDPKFQKDVSGFMDAFGELTQKIIDGLRLLHLIPGPDDPGAQPHKGPWSPGDATPPDPRQTRAEQLRHGKYGAWFAPGYAIEQGVGGAIKNIDSAFGFGFNNPGNVRNANGKGFRQFNTPGEGIVAMAKQLQRYEDLAKFHHADTVAKIVATYAPAADHNDVGAYIKDVTGRTGFGADQHLDLHDQATLAKLVSAMTHHENRHSTYTPATVIKILNQTGASVHAIGAQIAQ